MDKKLYRSSNDKVLAGVCGGIGEYFAVDSVIIRLLWVVFTLAFGAGLIAYIIAAIIIPAYDTRDKSYNGENRTYTGTEDPASEQERRNRSKNTSMVLGAILVLFGAFILIKDYIPQIPSDLFLAAALIGLGIFFLVRKK